MPRFEVFIPAAESAGFNVTFRVDAANWMAALKTGMQKLGEQGANVQNILVDIQDDNSVHVTESASGRVFRIRELTDAEAAQAQVKRTPTRPSAPAVPAAPPPPPEPAREERTQPGVPNPFYQPPPEARTIPGGPMTEPEMPAPPPAPVRAPPPPAPAPAPAPRVEKTPLPLTAAKKRHRQSEAESVVELEAPTKPFTGQIGRPQSKSKKDEIEDLLAEVFEKVQEVYSQPNEEAALYFLLDLALKKIPAESGTVFMADLGSGDLTFRAVRGPKAKELLSAKMVIPAGTGIVGFCAVEGVTVAISDVEKDPRYFGEVAEKVNYSPKSILCAPMMTHGRSFGCLQILNKSNNSTFNEVEIGLASYIAHQAAMYLNTR